MVRHARPYCLPSAVCGLGTDCSDCGRRIRALSHPASRRRHRSRPRFQTTSGTSCATSTATLRCPHAGTDRKHPDLCQLRDQRLRVHRRALPRDVRRQPRARNTGVYTNSGSRKRHDQTGVHNYALTHIPHGLTELNVFYELDSQPADVPDGICLQDITQGANYFWYQNYDTAYGTGWYDTERRLCKPHPCCAFLPTPRSRRARARTRVRLQSCQPRANDAAAAVPRFALQHTPPPPPSPSMPSNSYSKLTHPNGLNGKPMQLTTTRACARPRTTARVHRRAMCHARHRATLHERSRLSSVFVHRARIAQVRILLAFRNPDGGGAILRCSGWHVVRHASQPVHR